MTAIHASPIETDPQKTITIQGHTRMVGQVYAGSDRFVIQKNPAEVDMTHVQVSHVS